MSLSLKLTKPTAIQWPIVAYTVESIDQNFDALFANWRIFSTAWDALTHNGLTGLQGGMSAQYYHLTATQQGQVAATNGAPLLHEG